MEPKTNLNNTQRKMLDKVFKERIKKKVRAFRDRRDEQRTKLTAQELDKAKKSKEVKEAEKLYKQFKATEEKLAAKGISLRTKSDNTLEVYLGGRYGGTQPFAIEAFDAETRNLDERITEAETEIRARIYGMDTSYEEVDKELLSYLSFLDVK